MEQAGRWDGRNDRMTRTIGTASNHKKCTWSWWIKRSGIGAYLQIAHTYDGGGINFMFYDTDKLYSDVASGSDSGNSDAVFRDTNGWAHIVDRIDKKQGSNDDRVRVYQNGNELSGIDSYISKDTVYKLNKSDKTI